MNRLADRVQLDEGWELARTAPGVCAGTDGLGDLQWRPAVVPGTAAAALGAGPGGDGIDFDADDYWFRLTFAAPAAAGGEEVVLGLEGLATVAEVYLNGGRILDSESMYAGHELSVGALLSGENELAICCRALHPRLAATRRPRARWRTKLVAAGNLRFYRTMLLGRAPGFAPGPAVVGPWRPVWLERRSGLVLENLRLRAGVQGEDGVVDVTARLRRVGGGALPAQLKLSVGEVDGPLGVTAAPADGETEGATPDADGRGMVSGTLTVRSPERWWPHTHGRPALYDVRISVAGHELARRRVGFRTLATPGDLGADGPALTINGERVFARGAVWAPLDLRAPHARAPVLRAVLERLAAAGMNMLRIPGTAAYESDAFHDLCDELGILVWQDFMFANLDYPESDPDFMAAITAEVRAMFAGIAHRPSLAVLCGGSEVAQQVAMLGLDPALAEGPLYGELLPALVAEAGIDAPYIPSSPWGGELPFRTDSGVSHYYGVGGYRRPLADARAAQVRFTSECLAFANVPDEGALADLRGAGGGPVTSVTEPGWKAGVPRDAGSGWDFDDIRDHYLAQLFAVDPVALRSTDQERYLELSRATSGEVMAEAFGEWRRAASPCVGALVLWAKDLMPGAGWGVLDHRGAPKVAYHHLRRALAAAAVWTTDEGLNGIAVHVANDGAEPFVGRLRVALYRDFEVRVEEAVQEITLAPHSGLHRGVEAIIGRFVDAAWAYRFGPPAQDLIAVSLERDRDGETELVSQAFRFPAGRPALPQSAAALGLSATIEPAAGGGHRVRVASRRFAYGVRIAVAGYEPADDAFGIEPGHERLVALRRTGPGAGDGTGDEAGTAVPAAPPVGALTALNLAGRVRAAV